MYGCTHCHGSLCQRRPTFFKNRSSTCAVILKQNPLEARPDFDPTPSHHHHPRCRASQVWFFPSSLLTLTTSASRSPRLYGSRRSPSLPAAAEIRLLVGDKQFPETFRTTAVSFVCTKNKNTFFRETTLHATGGRRRHGLTNSRKRGRDGETERDSLLLLLFSAVVTYEGSLSCVLIETKRQFRSEICCRLSIVQPNI